MEPPKQPTPNHEHGWLAVIQPVFTAQPGPPVDRKKSISAERSGRSQPLSDAVALVMQVSVHAVELAGNAAVSWAGTEPDN